MILSYSKFLCAYHRTNYDCVFYFCDFIVGFAHLSGWFVLVALAAYLTVGVILPIITTKLAREDGRRYRELVGEMNDFFLDSVRGMKEIQLFGYAKQRLDEIQQRSQKSIRLLSVSKTKKRKFVFILKWQYLFSTLLCCLLA